MDEVYILLLGFIEFGFQQQVCEVDNVVEWCMDFMVYVGQKRRFGDISSFCLFFRGFEFFFILNVLCDILLDRQVFFDLFVFFFNWCDGGVYLVK